MSDTWYRTPVDLPPYEDMLGQRWSLDGVLLNGQPEAAFDAAVNREIERRVGLDECEERQGIVDWLASYGYTVTAWQAEIIRSAPVDPRMFRVSSW